MQIGKSVLIRPFDTSLPVTNQADVFRFIALKVSAVGFSCNFFHLG